VTLLLVLARYFHRHAPPDGYRLRELVLPAIFVALPAALVLAEPNLGTTVILGLIFLTLTFAAGIRIRSLLLVAACGGGGLPFLWQHMKPYQKQRVLSFLDPDQDPLGAGYHMIQSKITVGSGMFWGKGFLQGTQNRLDFLPEKHTDFIFAVVAEEWGFVGAAILLALYSALLAKLLAIAWQARDRFGFCLAIGAVGVVFWQLLINLGMNLGVLPVVGVPLPLLSYGGSSLLTVMMCLGLALNVSTRRSLL
jgi:rod shape determining protein RodA